VHTFASILKTAELLLGLPSLTSADRDATSLLDMLDPKQPPAAPLILRPRACTPPPTQQSYHALLDRQIALVLQEQLHQSQTSIAAAHRSRTLAQIARGAGAKPTALLRTLEVMTTAWWQGRVLLQLATQDEVTRDAYLQQRALAHWFRTSRGALLFPSPSIALKHGP
jgi:hypothetical protein